MAGTVQLVDIVRRVNAMNRCSDVDPFVRAGWNQLLSQLLEENNCYAGFGYLPTGEVPINCEPGIISGKGKEILHPDPTRIFFCVHASLCPKK